MPATDVQTQVKILMHHDNKYGISLDCDIPELGQKPFRFIGWTGTGPAPKVGATFKATLHPKRRGKFWMDQGKFDDNTIEEVLGTPDEKPWMLDWDMVAAEPLKEAAALEPKTSPGGTVFVDGNLRYRISEEMVNDRESIRMVLTHGAGDGMSLYTSMEDVLSEAEPVAAWLNTRLAARLSDGPVRWAQGAGAVVTQVAETGVDKVEIETSDSPRFESQQQFREWVAEKIEKDSLWERESIIKAFQKNGYADSKAFFKQKGNNSDIAAKMLEDYHDEMAKGTKEGLGESW